MIRAAYCVDSIPTQYAFFHAKEVDRFLNINDVPVVGEMRK